VRNIADELQIRTPSLYNHMISKQELLRSIVEETTELVWTEFEAAVGGATTPTDRLREAIAAYALRHARHPREALIVNRDVEALDEPARTRVMTLRRRHELAVREIIHDGCDSGEFVVEVPFVVSFGLLEMCVSIARWFDPDGTLAADEVARQHGHLAVRLVATPRRR
jgi:AcrR family transcriptional regulator